MDDVARPPRGAAVARVPARGRRAPEGSPRLAPGRRHRPRSGERPVTIRAHDALVPAAVAAAGAIAYLIAAPDSADLAAQLFRADLGPAIVNTAWFGGHHVPAYSVLFPPLGALLGARVVGALATIAAAAAFGSLAGARLALWAVPALLAALVSGRITFLLGTAFGLTAVTAATRNPRPPSEKGQAPLSHPTPNPRLACGRGLTPSGGWLRVGVLGVVTALASPVAALFAGIAGLALALTGRRGVGVVLAVAVAVPTVVLAVAFPEGGDFPFVVSAFVPAFVAGVAVAVVAPRGSALAVGAALYALLCLVVFVLPNPIGGNATRLATLVAVPVAVHLLWPRRKAALAVLALPLAYWVFQPAVRDVVRTSGDPSLEASFYAPVLAALEDAGPVRVAVPLTENKGETFHLAKHVAIARGWERQLDRKRNALFYEGELTAPEYGRWLREEGVTHVALPEGVDFDPAGRAEARVVASAPPYLRETLRTRRWRLFAVRDSPGPGVQSLGRESFTARGSGIVKVRYSRYWTVTHGRGCVEEAPGGWTAVTAEAPGRVGVSAVLHTRGLFARGADCGHR